MTGMDLRPLSLGEILDRTFSLYRRHFLLFAGITAIPSLLTFAVSLWAVLLVQGELKTVIAATSGSQGGADNFPANVGALASFGSHMFLVSIVSFFVGLLVYTLIQGGTAFAVSESYFGRTTTVIASLQQAFRKLGVLFGTVLLTALAIGCGLILLVFPAFYFACRLLVAVPAALLENRGAGDSLSRSWNLTKDFAIRSFLVYVLFIVVYFALVSLLTIPLGLAFGLSLHNPAALGTFQVMQVLLSTVVRVIVSPLIMIATTIFYYDLRVRKEAFDLRFMMTGGSEPIPGGVPLDRLTPLT